ncbi:hypothetical protein TrLO_g15104 [Triparma laevis f. longispina]|uniref:Major facilitator superfamily (MFS) profile domain-containing protein n=1 Tax=Triparma laevis f. longispina TaxID=1714387 RepID=A0A9W7F6Z6_9STRA|nr:hypothetical protein TrLO_g15104 [Triparma laevis f. longispina]
MSSLSSSPSSPPPSSVVHAMIALLLTQSYLLISPFVYSGAISLWFYPHLTKSEAGFYAGFVSSSFMFGRTFSSYYWGKQTDKYGRKTILMLTLSISILLNVALGLCTTFPSFIFSRFLLGFFNCVPGVLKTIISESARGDKEWEQNTMGLVFGMWGAGFLIAPLISGWLSDPVSQFPDSQFVQHSFLTPMFKKYPFLLPNLFGGIVTFVCVIWLYVSLEETLPEEQREDYPIPAFLLNRFSFLRMHNNRYKRVRSDVEIELVETVETAETGIELAQSSGVELEKVEEGSSTNPNHNKNPKAANPPPPPPTTIKSLLSKRSTRGLLIVYWLFSFVIIATDEIVPLFGLNSNAGGLHLQVKSIGTFISAAGIIYVLIQYRAYKYFVNTLGRENCMVLGTLIYGPLSFLIPFVLFIPNSRPPGEMGWSRFIFLGLTIGLSRTFASMHFSSVSLLLNDSVEKEVRGTMNGLSTLGGSVMKFLGPIFAGVLFAGCVNSDAWGAKVGAFAAFFVTGLLAIGVGLMARSLVKEQNAVSDDNR